MSSTENVIILDENKDLSLSDLVSMMLSADSRHMGGALVVYEGIVKGLVDGNRVDKLVYDIHEEYTKKKLEEVVSEVLQDKDIIDARIIHWKGVRKPGSPAVVITVLATGRKKAFETAYKLLEKVKFETGIWKKEYRDDGVYWVIGDGERIKSSG